MFYSVPNSPSIKQLPKNIFAAFHHRVSDTGLLLKTERPIRDLTTELDTGLLLKTKMPTWSKRPETRLNMEYSGTLCDKITRSRWVSFNIPPRHYVNSWFIRLRLRNTVVWPMYTAQMFAWGGGYLYLYSVNSRAEFFWNMHISWALFASNGSPIKNLVHVHTNS